MPQKVEILKLTEPVIGPHLVPIFHLNVLLSLKVKRKIYSIKDFLFFHLAYSVFKPISKKFFLHEEPKTCFTTLITYLLT